MFLAKAESEIYTGVDHYGSGEPYDVHKMFFFCGKKQIFLYTAQNEIKGNFKHLDTEGGYLENHPMPKECTDYIMKWD